MKLREYIPACDALNVINHYVLIQVHKKNYGSFVFRPTNLQLNKNYLYLIYRS